MGVVVNLGKVLKIEMRVNLCRADIGMAEHLLHGAQVARRLQQMRGKRVTQHVRGDMYGEAMLLSP